MSRPLHVVESWLPAATGYATRSFELVAAQARRADVAPAVVVSSRQWCYTSEPAGPPVAGVPLVQAPVTPRERRIRRLRAYDVDGAALRERIMTAARPHEPTVVHVHWGSTIGAAAAAAAEQLRVPLVAEVRFDLAGAVAAQTLRITAPPVEQALRRWFERHLRQAAAVVAASFSLAQLLRQLFPVIADRVVVVPNGVDTTAFRPHPRDAVLAASLRLEGPVVGAVTNLLRYEGIDLLVDAVRQLRSQGRRVSGLVVGGGPELARLRSAAAAAGVPVRFTGPVARDRVADHYALLDVVVLPRRDVTVTRYAAPLKLLEAMACGRPVLATSVGDVPALLAEGRGAVVAPDDARALATAIGDLLDDASHRGALGRAARAWSEEQDWAAAAAATVQAYRAAGIS